MNEVRSFCRICIAQCGILVSVNSEADEPVVSKIRGDAEHPVSQGYTCPKGRGLARLHHAPDRLQFPRLAARPSSKQVQVGWDQLLDDLASRLSDVIDACGPDGVAFYLATGASYDGPGRRGVDHFVRQLGTAQKYTALTVDNPAKPLAAELVGGWPWLNPMIDEKACTFVLLIGINPVTSHGHTSGMSNPRTRLRAMRKKGEVWVMDPRRTETADLATRYLPVRAGADAYVLGFLVRQLLIDGADREFLATTARDVSALETAVDIFTLDFCAERSGLDAQALVDLLGAVRSAGRLSVLTGTGVTMSAGSNLIEWLRWALLIITGSVDRPGGMWFNPGYLSQLHRRDLPISGPDGFVEAGPRSRPELGKRFGEMPCAAMASEIESGHVRALIVVGGNPLRSFPDSERTLAALETLEVLATVDVIQNATTELATHVLPAVDQLERADVSYVLDALSDRVMSQRTNAVVPATGDRRPMWWAFAQLERRMGFGAFMGVEDPDELSDDRIIDHLVSGARDPEALASAPAVVVAEDDMVFGWVTERVIPEGRWRLAPRLILDQLPAFLAQEPDGLVLIPRRMLGAMNGVTTDLTGASGASARPDILLHPLDAEERRIDDGAWVAVRSKVGVTHGIARVTDDLGRGTVSMPHGWAVPSVNRLTSSDDVDALTGMPLFSGVRIWLEPLEGGPGGYDPSVPIDAAPNRPSA